MRLHRLPVLFALLLMGLAPSVTRAEDADAPYDVQPLPNIDENLFLVRALGYVYTRWPQDPTDARGVLAFTADTRQLLLRYRQRIVTQQLDPAVGGMYDDALKLLDDYESCLAELGEINRKDAEQASKDAGRALVTGIYQGAQAAQKAKDLGATQDQAKTIGSVAVIGEGINDYDKRTANRKTATASEVAAATARVKRLMDASLKRRQADVVDITARHGWAVGEAGFEGGTPDPKKGWPYYVERRPRDPFAKLCEAWTLDNAGGVDNEREAARLCFQASRFVPAGGDGFYDGLKRELIEWADFYAVRAAAHELDYGSFTNNQVKFAPDALHYARTLLAAEPDDPTGFGQYQLAWALAINGRLEESSVAADKAYACEAYKSDPTFAFFRARLCAAKNKPDVTEDWLRHAYRLGFCQVDWLRKDADFQTLRAAKPQVFDELTTIHTTGSIKFGLVNDDYVFANHSPFRLTDVQLDVTVIQGDQVWKKHLVTGYLDPGRQCTFSDVFSIPGSKYDTLRATLTTDQDER